LYRCNALKADLNEKLLITNNKMLHVIYPTPIPAKIFGAFPWDYIIDGACKEQTQHAN